MGHKPLLLSYFRWISAELKSQITPQINVLQKKCVLSLQVVLIMLNVQVLNFSSVWSKFCLFDVNDEKKKIGS